MERLILPDGSAIGSGVWGQTAICHVTWTQNRSRGSGFPLGAAVESTLEITLFSPSKPELSPGTRLIYEENGEKRGVFYAQELQRQSKHLWLLQASDGLTRFDRELEDFWDGRQTTDARSLVQALCLHCAVTANVPALPQVPVPPLPGYTGRQVLQLVSQAVGQYFYMDPEEALCAGWYTQRLPLTDYSRLQCAGYATAPVERVLLRQDKTDAGALYPPDAPGGNTLILQGNPIFSGADAAMAREVLERVQAFSHTPFTCRLLPGQEVPPGCLVEFTDLDGALRTGAVMRWQKRDGTLTVQGLGSYRLPADGQELTLESVDGQLLNISRTAKGLQVRHRDLEGNLQQLQLGVSGIRSRVTAVENDAGSLTTHTTALRQDAQALSLAVSRLSGALADKTDREELSQVTEHFRFDETGMTIHNTASGMGIWVSENQVAFTGGDDPTTLIRPDDMQTARLTVEKRLDLGDFSLLPRSDGNLSLRYTGNR